MKNIKIIIILLTVAILMCGGWFVSGADMEYMLAELTYSKENKIESDIIFSKPTGFYEDAFELKVYAPSKEIYYTLDGSEPTKESYRYENSIMIYDASENENTNSERMDVSSNFFAEGTAYKVPVDFIDKCTILKVAYYDKMGRKSKSEERVYFVGFDEKSGYENVNIISITADPEDLFGNEKGIYVLGETFEKFESEYNINDYAEYIWDANYKKRGIEWEREAQIHVFNAKKELVLSQKTGIRVQGGASRSFNPKSLNIYARDEYSYDQLRYDFWGTGYYPKRVTLTTGGNDYYGKMKDRLVAELSENSNFSKMHYSPYVLFLNGEYWGVYYLTEKYDENYVEHYYSVNRDNVIMIKNNGLETGTAADFATYEKMRNFIEQADMRKEENYKKSCELIDMDSFIDYYATEIYIARNIDWPEGNFALWRSRGVSERNYEDGKWRWMLFDVNTDSLRGGLVDHDTLAYVLETCPMFENLSQNSQFRNAFSKRLREIRDSVFEEQLANEKIDEYKLLMTEPMEKHLYRFFNINGEKFREERSDMRAFIALRTDYIDIMLKQNGFD